MNSKLRIAILIDENLIPAWAYKMLQNIQKNANNNIVLIVKNKSANKLINENENFLYKLYNKLDQQLFNFSPNAFELKNIDHLINVNTLEVNPIQTDFDDVFLEKDITLIKNYKLDILIKLGFRKLSGEILKSTRFGVWQIVNGDTKTNGKGSQWFSDVFEKKTETCVQLQILRENADKGIVLYNSFSSIHNTSPNFTKNTVYWKAASFIPTKLAQIQELGEDLFFKNIPIRYAYPTINSNKINKIPSKKELLKFGINLTFKKIKNKLNDVFYFEQWMLLFFINSTKIRPTSFNQFAKMLPPKDRIWADPFFLKRDDNYYIFIEEMIYAENKGYISVITMDTKGNYTAPVKVLERPYHLSYPFLIEDNGNLYMIPETRDNNTIELYKCTNFPLKWELEKILIKDITAVDTTILVKDNKYWLFTNVVKNEGASDADELFLYFSNSLVSDNWKPHPLNPIVSDVKKSRGAGAFYFNNTNIYRPAQNCAKYYGHGITINQITELSELNYSEKVVETIFPNWDKNLVGTHTINSADNLTVIDGILKRRK